MQINLGNNMENCHNYVADADEKWKWITHSFLNYNLTATFWSDFYSVIGKLFF